MLENAIVIAKDYKNGIMKIFYDLNGEVIIKEFINFKIDE